MSARFFTQQIRDNTALVTGEDVAHILRVLRMREGDEAVICDGAGAEWDGALLGAAPDGVRFALSNRRSSPGEPLCRVTLYQCLPKAGKMETILQKCVELGVSRVVPTLSKYCVAEPGDYDKKLQRLSRVSLEAAKQSRRGVVPEVTRPLSLREIPVGEYDTALCAYELTRNFTLKQALRDRRIKRTAALIIGPEGGFAPEEADMLRAKGARLVSLGPRILRTETAGMAMLAQLMYEVEL